MEFDLNIVGDFSILVRIALRGLCPYLNQPVLRHG
jgi:hypothetical protein